MKMLEKILVATDFGRSADDALKTAQALGDAFGSTIILVHVIPKIPESPVSLDSLKADSRKRLRALRSRLERKGVRTGSSVVAVGSSFDQIIEVSELLDVNLIVTGSGESVDAGAHWLALTSERLVSRATKPVWVVRSGTVPVFERILCPVDFSDPSAQALTNAVHLARKFQAELTVLTVTQSLAGLYASSARLAGDAQAKFLREEERQADAFLGQFDFTDVRWEKVMMQGVPEREILKFAREWSADLIVMGSVGRTGLARIVLGTVAAGVLREMPCSMMTLKAEHAIRLQVEAEIADIGRQWERGQEMLENGFPEDAIRQFRKCLLKDSLCVPAMQGLSDAHARIGRREEAETYDQMAKRVRKSMLQGRAEAAVRSEDPPWPKH